MPKFGAKTEAMFEIKNTSRTKQRLNFLFTFENSKVIHGPRSAITKAKPLKSHPARSIVMPKARVISRRLVLQHEASFVNTAVLRGVSRLVVVLFRDRSTPKGPWPWMRLEPSVSTPYSDSQYDRVTSSICGDPVGDVIDADLAIVDLTVLGAALLDSKDLISLALRADHLVKDAGGIERNDPILPCATSSVATMVERITKRVKVGSKAEVELSCDAEG
jgi:hypothetical protein